MTAILSYIRSAFDGDQLGNTQQEILLASNADMLYIDTGSSRDGFTALLAEASPGDVVLVTSLDRLGRSLTGVIHAVGVLAEAGLELRSLAEGVDNRTPNGCLLRGLLHLLVGYDRKLTRERAATARTAAHSSNRQIGRPPRLSAEQMRELRRRHENGASVPELAEAYGCSRATVYRMLSS